MATGLQASAVCRCVHAGQTAGYVWSTSPELNFRCLGSQGQGNQRKLGPLLGPRKHMQAKCQGLLGPRVCRSHSPQALLTTLFLQQALYSLPFKFPLL